MKHVKTREKEINFRSKRPGETTNRKRIQNPDVPLRSSVRCIKAGL